MESAICDGSETPCIILLRIALLLYMISTVVLMCTIVVYKLAFHLINLTKFSSCFNTSVRIRIRFSNFLDPDLDPVSAKILENCRKVSKSDLSEENLKFMTKDRQKM